MTDRERIIDRIKKCLALSKSSNEHEAQAALRQAQKLMAAHNVTELEVDAAGAEECRAKAGAFSRPSRWETHLAVSVGDAFGCRCILGHNILGSHGEWCYIGCPPSAEIAKYAFEVLFRQAKRARADYIKSQLKRCGPVNRTRRADLYSEGWVQAATRAIEEFQGSAQQVLAIEAYVSTRYPRLSSIQPTNRNEGRSLSHREEGDRWAGFIKGRDAELNRGVAGSSHAQLEG